MGNPTTTVLYARVSTKDQEREGFSIPAQLKLLRDYARQQRLTILQEFTDVETAKHAGRGQFNAMLTFLQTANCRTVLVEKTDRLYRNLKDWVTIDELDLTVHFVREGAVVSRASGSSDKFMHGIKVLMAKNYVDNLSEEVKKGLREKIAQGHYPGVARVGYVNNRVTRRIDVDPVRGPLVMQIFAAYASDGYSLKALTRYARTLGLRHHQRDRWLVTSEIHRLLRNPLYTGDFRWLGTRHTGSHTPLVTHEVFNQVQRLLGGSKRPRKGRQHPFMGLLDCGRCGCRITAERKKGRYIYYHCSGSKGACGNTYIRQEALAEQLEAVIAPIQITPAIAEDLAGALRVSDDEAARHRAETLRHLDQRRRAIVSKLDRGYEDFVSGRISTEFWTRKSQEWEAELQLIDVERARVQAPPPLASVTADKILELAKQAVFLYRTQDSTEQRRLLEIVLSNCTFNAGSLCPTYRKPFDLLVQGNKTQDWR